MSRVLVCEFSKVVVWGACLFGWVSLVGQVPESAATAGSAGATGYVPHMTFDVVSIREYKPHGGFRMPPVNFPYSGYYQAEEASVWGLILWAYDIKALQQIQNVPDWAKSNMYTITGKSDPSTDAALLKLSEADAYAEKRHMLQAMLADRFHLQIHEETKVAATYELVATERTAKLMTPAPVDGKTVSTCNEKLSAKGREIDSKGCPFNALFSRIQGLVDTPLLDHTGIDGKAWYAYDLTFSPPGSGAAGPGVERYPELEDALHDQLGLELRKTKGTVTFWVVDHVERPTPN